MLCHIRHLPDLYLRPFQQNLLLVRLIFPILHLLNSSHPPHLLHFLLANQVYLLQVSHALPLPTNLALPLPKTLALRPPTTLVLPPLPQAIQAHYQPILGPAYLVLGHQGGLKGTWLTYLRSSHLLVCIH